MWVVHITSQRLEGTCLIIPGIMANYNMQSSGMLNDPRYFSFRFIPEHVIKDMTEWALWKIYN